jgi:hypothetical protein
MNIYLILYYLLLVQLCVKGYLWGKSYDVQDNDSNYDFSIWILYFIYFLLTNI